MSTYSTVRTAEKTGRFVMEIDASGHSEVCAIAEKLGVKPVLLEGSKSDYGYTYGFLNAFNVKDQLKASGFVWSSVFKAWFGSKDEVMAMAGAK